MVTATITSYSISVFLHVTAVVVGFGATFAEAIMFPVAMRLDSRHLPTCTACSSPSTGGSPARRS